MKKWLWTTALVFISPLSVGAQAESVAPGARVRVTAPTDNLKGAIGTVAEVRVDSIVLVSKGGSRAVALTNITRLDVSTGRRSMFLRDTGIGLGIGTLAGVVIGYATYQECEEEGFMSCFLVPEDRGQAAMWGGVVGGAAGTLTGALIGVFHRGDRWRPVRVSTKVAVRPAAGGGITVGLTRAF